MKNNNRLIIDLESSCCNNEQFPREEMETIEIGAAVCDSSWQVIDRASFIIKPTLHPTLTSFCTELTGIQQSSVDVAEPFPLVVPKFQAWLAQYQPICAWMSWGKADWHQIVQDCDRHQCEYPFEMPHINLKAEFPRSQGSRKRVSMKSACQQLGLTLEGRHHSGLDDALNIVRIISASPEFQERIEQVIHEQY